MAGRQKRAGPSVNSLECGGPAPLWPDASCHCVERLRIRRCQAAADQSGARPPRSKESRSSLTLNQIEGETLLPIVSGAYSSVEGFERNRLI